MSLDPKTLKVNDRYNWKHQPERLVFIGKRRYPGDRRYWYQFENVDYPGIVWCEIIESDLDCLELS